MTAERETRAGAGRRMTGQGAGRRQRARALVVEALRDSRSVNEVAASHNLTPAALRRRIRRELTARLPRSSGTLTGGVCQPVEIVRDQYGIPHVFARTEADAYAGLGFVVAQDRLWQLEYRRRWAYGTLAEVLGPAGVANDATARTLRFDAIAEAEHAAHPAETRQLLDAFADGINAAIAAFGDDLPIELDILGIRPAPWRAIDTVTIARASLWQFSGRIENIVIGEAAERLLPPDLAARFLSVEFPTESILPGASRLDAADGLPFSRRGEARRGRSRASRKPLEPRARGVRERRSEGEDKSPAPGRLGSEGRLPASAEGRPPVPGAPFAEVQPPEPQGSNQWAVGPALSTRGAPLLASDGHVPYYQPSTRYEVHVAGGAADVVGIADVGVPLIHNGRTRGVAWGLTNNVSSVRDLYAEEPRPGHPDEVRDGDGWATLATREEVIQVRGADPIRLTVRTSPRGPIVNHLISSVDPAGDQPLALRWVGLDPRDCITGGLQLARAQTADEARATHKLWQFSGQNPGFADTTGAIGYQMRIRFPVRGRQVRGYRAPDRPEDAWQEPIPFELLPAERSPARGWIGSANQRPHPPESDLPLYGAYGDGSRGRRIRALLDQEPDRRGDTLVAPFTLDDMGAMQNDVYSVRAAALKDALARLLTTDGPSGASSAVAGRSAGAAPVSSGTVPAEPDPGAGASVGAPRPAADLARAARLLRRWDCRFTVGSVGASLFAAFWGRWCDRIAAARFPKHLRAAMAGAAGAIAHDLLRGDDLDWFPADAGSDEPGEARVRSEARAAMADALAWLGGQLGPDWRGWTWGRLHPVTLTHALSAGRPVFASFFDIGPRPCPGGIGVLNQNGYVVRDRFRVTSGPHYRFLADLAEPDRAMGCNTAGNSGNPASPHYADQFDDWLAGRYHAISLDRARIEAEATLLLTPTEST